jgi:hypothetical protein
MFAHDTASAIAKIKKIAGIIMISILISPPYG